MKKDNPCRDCTERIVGCHSTCNRYSEWSAEHKRQKDEIRRKRDELNCVNNYSFHAGERIKKQKGMNRK